ncbi:MAG TPA: HPP family protein, partial [Ktedonobacterales bacterium]
QPQSDDTSAHDGDTNAFDVLEHVVLSVEQDVATTEDILRGLIVRARMPWLLRHHKRPLVLALFSVLMGGVSLVIISVIALVTGSPFVFPSLGPTAYLFFYRPGSVAASPRSTLTGCALGIVGSYVILLITGLAGAPPATLVGMTWSRVIAVALAFSLTTALLVFLSVDHPPALATALLIALGVFARPLSLVALYGGVVLLTAEAFLINHAAGLPYPLWRANPRAFQRAVGEARASPPYAVPPEG